VSGVAGWFKRWLRLAVRRPEPSAAAAAGTETETETEADVERATELAGDELDLHSFLPRDTADAVAEYVEWAAQQGLARVRIIHGKGTGTQRRIVHAVLRRHPCVIEFGTGGERGGWGSTWVSVRARPGTGTPS
jgi:dsDNA-specific endonuclease/ATPase MutS2